MAKEVVVVDPKTNSEKPERGCGKFINWECSTKSGDAYPGTDVYLERKGGKRLEWRCWRTEGKNDCGMNAEVQNCTTDRKGKGTNLFVPSS